MKGRIVSIILFLVGLLNLAPVMVFFSPASSVRFYGLELVGNDIAILTRHRGVLLGLLGLALVYAAFRKEFVVPAIIAALVGKFAFLFLVWSSLEHSAEIGQVAIFDIAAIILLVVAGSLHLFSPDAPSRL